MHRRRSAAVSTFALILFSPLIGSGASATADAASSPPGPEHDASVLPANATAGAGRVTATMRAEIDRVVSAGRTPAARATARSAPATLADTQIRCAEFEGQRYCLNTGWTTKTESTVQRQVAGQATAVLSRGGSASAAETTGDLATVDLLRQRAAMSPAERAAAEREELVAAAQSVAKVWLLRHQVQGKPLPEGFVERHPEITVDSAPVAARTTSQTATTTAVKPPSAYPERFKILYDRETHEQIRSYWCGPGSMQTIGWGWRGYRNTQGYWADKLGTTSSGTAISQMVRVTNAYTGYDQEKYAGKYIVLDISDWSYSKWWLLQMRHIRDYKAPVILHPILLKQFYPYLDDDASGHFQVGRGYDKNGGKGNLLKYFEPWNQQRFDPSEPFISRTQTRSAYKSYRANRAHSMQNIGV